MCHWQTSMGQRVRYRRGENLGVLGLLGTDADFLDTLVLGLARPDRFGMIAFRSNCTCHSFLGKHILWYDVYKQDV